MGKTNMMATDETPCWLRKPGALLKGVTSLALKTAVERKGPLDLFVLSPTLCLSLFPSKRQFFFVPSPPPPFSVLLSKGSPGSQCRVELGTNSQEDGLSSVSVEMSRINCCINISSDFLIQSALWQRSREQGFLGRICFLFLICSYKQFISKTVMWKEQCFH